MSVSPIGVATVDPGSASLSKSSLKLNIEPNATVAQSCEISLQTITLKTTENEKECLPNVTLTITGGNVFHPQSQITLLIPTTIDGDGNHVEKDAMIQIQIGENNLLEENSHLLLDLSSLNPEQDPTNVITIMGSYNQFAPRCHVQSQKIGNGNIFHPMCHLKIQRIRNGNIFQPFVRLDEEEINNSNELDFESMQSFQEKVFYLLSTNNDYGKNGTTAGIVSPPPAQMVRSHTYGMKKNIKEVGLLLATMRIIVQKNHRVLSRKIKDDGKS